MKTLYLVRHAKSDKDNETLLDIDRPLNARGYREANEMSLLFKQKNSLPDLIITSPAIRAFSTALIFCRNFNLNAADILIKPALYETTVKEYMKVVTQTDDHLKSIMLFGHNPTITNFANILTSRVTEEIPTCGIAGITGDFKNWNKFADIPGELMFFDFPRK